MAEMKTKVNEASVTDFLNKIKKDQKRQDSMTIVGLMKEATGLEPRMWGSSIVGFGRYHYVYESGREGDMPEIGFSPRVQTLVLYLHGGTLKHEALLKKLGKHKTSKACLYINKLEDVDVATLRKMIRQSVKLVRKEKG